jgi:tRNA (guanine26-N2/guanine27-N2)-dimethyltransferase
MSIADGGVPHREGRTLMLLPSLPEDGQGPGTKASGKVFYNPAMAGSRTRSVLLLRHALDMGFLGEGTVYALDGLTASGLRARRWLNELPAEMSERVSATIVDLEEEALRWAEASHNEFPPSQGGGILEPSKGDLRSVVLRSGRHWVDIDPYGSPMPFIDSAMQSMARSGVMEVSATDTAALTGSSSTALMRRYGARVRTDSLAHDSGMRVMLANFSRVAARHDRAIVPLLSVWDSHHLRVSFRVLKSVSTANELEDSIGWRVHSPTKEEVSASIDAGLHPNSSVVHLPMHCMLPLKFPIDRRDPRVSGPLWVGPMGDRDAMSSMTEENALESSGPEFSVDDPLGWDERRVEAERRRVARSVRHISEESGVISSSHLVVVDDLAAWLGSGAPPSPRKIVDMLNEAGHSAGVSSYGRPSFRANAPWEAIVESAMSIQPPM